MNLIPEEVIERKRWSQTVTTSNDSNSLSIYHMHLLNRAQLCLQMLASNTELARKLDAIEKKYDAHFKVVFDAIRQLMSPPEAKKRKVGFRREDEN